MNSKKVKKMLAYLIMASMGSTSMLSYAQELELEKVSESRVQIVESNIQEYVKDYENVDEALNWVGNGLSGTQIVSEGENKVLKVAMGIGEVIDKNSPVLSDGTLEFDFKADNPSRFGFVIRGSEENHITINKDLNNNTWRWSTKNGYGEISSNGEMTKPNTWYHMKIIFVGDEVRLWVDDTYIGSVRIPNAPTEGQWGLSSWYEYKNISIDNVRYTSEILEEQVTTLGISHNGEKLKDGSVINVVPGQSIEFLGECNTQGVQWILEENDQFKTLITDNVLEVQVGEGVQDGEIYAIKVQTLDGTKTQTISLKVKTILESYERNYENAEESINWQGPGKIGAQIVADGENHYLQVGARVGEIIDQESPSIENGILELDFKVNEPSRFGFVVRASEEDYININKDLNNTTWRWSTKNNYGEISSNGEVTEPNMWYHLKIKFVDETITLWVDNKKIGSIALPGGPKEGKLGLYSWYQNKNISIDNISYRELPNQAIPPVAGEIYTLESNAMKVKVDSAFPRVVEYEINGKSIKGQENPINQISINGEKLVPTDVTSTLNGSTIDYNVKIQYPDENMDYTIGMRLSADENILKFEVTSLEVVEGEPIISIGIPNHNLVTVTEADEHSTLAMAASNGGWHGISETYGEVKDLEVVSGYNQATYGYISGNGLGASIENNVINGNDRLRMGVIEKDGQKQAFLSNGEWICQEVSEEEVSDQFINLGGKVEEELPWAKVIITEDRNQDDYVDWQDAAIAYRDELMAKPFGYETTKDHYMYVAGNSASSAQTPFLQSLDTAKVLYNYTDGFGQNILHKGYQAEGHDDSHPDYGGHIGIRQGGAKDFNTLANEGEKYNANVGVHINATEYMLDAFETSYDNLIKPFSGGWGWYDQSYYVDQRKDITTGELARRLDMLDEEVPGLDFIYVDVYSGIGWNAKQLVDNVNENGWFIGTEFAGPMDVGGLFTHWGQDVNYPNKGNSSRVHRFVKNSMVDSYTGNALLKGAKMPGVTYGWGEKGIKEGIELFYNENLPTKYMQYFDILKWEDDQVTFTNGVQSTRRGDGKIYLTKDNKVIAHWKDTGTTTDENERHIAPTTLFIPWNPLNEEKIYHWNPDGGITEWEVPESWSEVQNISLYKLGHAGSEFYKEIPVENGKVTIEAEARTGYVAYKDGSAPESVSEWGEGGYVKDPGFDSGTFEYWNKESSLEDTTHIAYKLNGKLEQHLEISGNGGADAKLSQTIDTLEPGKTYTATVWTDITEGRRASLAVKDYGGKIIESSVVSKKHVANASQKFKNTGYQKLKVVFTMPEDQTSATLVLAAGEGTESSYVKFEDVRVWENPSYTPQPGDEGFEQYVLFEDFENVEQGWGPLQMGTTHYNEAKHMVERNDEKNQYEQYVLEGNWSLKSADGTVGGEIFKTGPSSLVLEPNTTYKVGFKYTAEASAFAVKVLSKEGNEVVLDEKLEKTLNQKGNGTEPFNGAKEVEYTFTTGNNTDYYLTFVCDKAMSGGESSILILDDLYVKDESVEPEEKQTRVTLNGSYEVKSGEKFEVVLGLEDIQQSIYAGDFSVLYDQELFNLESVSAVDPTVIAGKQEIQENILRILTATEGGAIQRKDLITFNFKAKEGIEGKAQGVIEAKDIKLGVVAGESAYQEEVDNVKKVVEVIGEQKPVTEDEDINEDGQVDVGDLALIAYYYQQKQEGNDNWDAIKKADVNKDGVINIQDLTMVANRILK